MIMATIKSCTDLSQSKRLAEFLSSDSADFFWIIGRLHTDGPRYERILPRNEVSEPENHWPCWSLTALLKVIPKHIKDYNVFRIDIGDNDFSAWYDEIGFGVNNDLPDITMKEPIDACCAVILKLHEQKYL